jgi:hypothetical protein
MDRIDTCVREGPEASGSMKAGKISWPSERTQASQGLHSTQQLLRILQRYLLTCDVMRVNLHSLGN